jgi:hypothetical protein
MNEQLVKTKVPEKKQIKKNEECVELKNIKYQTMLINNSNTSGPIVKENIENIDNFLSMEKQHNQKQPWCKLGDGTKIRKLHEYINELCLKNKDNDERKKRLKVYLKKCLERKKLQRVKDVQYNVNTGKIINIPGLKFNKDKNKYTLKNVDKKTSTLKSLAPKRRKKKKKKKEEKEEKGNPANKI